MELVFHIFLSWFAIAYFVTVLPRKDLVINLILYSILLIINVSISTSIYLNLGLVGFTEDKIKFAAINLNRGVLRPIELIIFSSLYYKLDNYLKRIISIAFLLIYAYLLELINLKLQLYTYIKWNLMFHIVLYSANIFITLILSKLIHAFRQWGESVNDNNIR